MLRVCVWVSVCVVQVFYFGLVMHRSESLYKDANTFNPDRWGPGGCRATAPNFISFHGGPRTCLGQDMAYVGTSHVLCVRLYCPSRVAD